MIRKRDLVVSGGGAGGLVGVEPAQVYPTYAHLLQSGMTRSLVWLLNRMLP